MNKKIIYIVAGFLLVAIDQLSKLLLVGFHKNFGFFSLNYTTNKGISFGLFQGSTIIISVISVIVLGLLYYYRKEFENKEIFLTLIVSGIIGNLIDRIFLGYVRDFFDLHWFPVFNVADSLMFIGVVGFIIAYIIAEKKKTNK